MKKVWLAVVAVASLFACGPSNSWSGTVQGNNMAVKEAIYAISAGTSGGQSLVLIMDDKGNACSLAQQNAISKNTTFFEIIAGNVDNAGNLKALANGTYTVVPLTSNTTGNIANVYFDKTNATCNSALANGGVSGDSGNVKIDGFSTAANGNAHGSFDVHFGGDHVTGTFAATYCQALLNNGNAPTCQ